MNRATFYAHFEDKYDLVDYIVEDFATVSFEDHISDSMIFNQENVSNLILAVHDFYQNQMWSAVAAILDWHCPK